jgi:hypothetical protein
MEKQMTPAEAWQDFMSAVWPSVRNSMTRNERREISTAQRDFEGKRNDRYGKPISLGPERIARLLERFAPGRYRVERHDPVFWVKIT